MHPRFSLVVGLILIGALLVCAAGLILPLQVIARARGLDITTEAYPYTAGMTGWVPMIQTVLAF